MYRFPIGVMLESFRLPTEQAIEKAAAIGAQGIQMYATKGEHAPENMTGNMRRELLSRLHGNGLVFSAICGDLGMGFGMSDSDDRIYIGNLTSAKIKSILQSLVKDGYYDFTSMRYQSAKRLSKVVFDDENHLPYTSEITIDAFPSQLISINCASNKLPHFPNTVVNNEMLFGNIEDDTDEEEDEDMD